MLVHKLKAKPIEVLAIKWENNEEQIRAFVQDDTLLQFPDSGLRIWNDEERAWIPVLPLHYVIKGIKGELTSESPEMLERKYTFDTE